MTLTGGTFRGLLLLLVLAAFAAVVVAWPRLGGRAPVMLLARAGALALVNVLVVVTVMTQLNAQYLFFTGWGDLLGSMHPASSSVTRGAAASVASRLAVAGSPRLPSPLPSVPPLPLQRIGPDRVISFTVRGRLSGISGTVLVQLPPGYTSGVNAGRRYPVLETFSGYPGSPAQWLKVMGLGGALDRAVQAGRIGPALIVSPQVEIPPGTDTECVNGKAGTPQVETWLSEDVPYWVQHTFRADGQRSAWSTIGLSAGGWCAAMVTMLHPQQYSAAVVMAGYFRPKFPAGAAPFPAGSAPADRYDLVHLAAHRPPPVAIWLQTSHNDRLSYGPSQALIAGTRAPMAVSATVLHHAGHRIAVWQDQLSSALGWLGRNLQGFSPAGPGPGDQRSRTGTGATGITAAASASAMAS